MLHSSALWLLLIVSCNYFIARPIIASTGVSSGSTWSTEYSGTAAKPASSSKSRQQQQQQQQQQQPSWPNENLANQSVQKYSPLNSNHFYPPLDSWPVDQILTPIQASRSPSTNQAPTVNELKSPSNQSINQSATINLLDLLLKLSSLQSSTGNSQLARRDLIKYSTIHRQPVKSGAYRNWNWPKPAKLKPLNRLQSNELQDSDQLPGVVHFDEPLDQQQDAREQQQQFDQGDNSNGKDLLALWYDSTPAGHLSSSEPSITINSSPPSKHRAELTSSSLIDNLYSSTKYSGFAQPIPTIYSIPAFAAEQQHQHHKLSQRKGAEKSLVVPVLVGVGAGLLSFLLISNLFLSIPLIALTLMQFFNGQNMFMPNNNNNSNGNQATPTTSNANLLNGRKKRDLVSSLEQTVHRALENGFEKYQYLKDV